MISLWNPFSLKTHHGRSKTFSEHHRARTMSETTSVSFIIHIYFQNILYINFYICKITVLTLVLTQVCRLWVMYHVDTPTTVPKLISPKQPRWSK